MHETAVVICNFNKKDYVLRCIESVFSSDFIEFDLIVVDNASSDGSAEAIKERYVEKLTLLVNEENLGGSGGFNRGMQYAMDKNQYKYIHLLDDDVIIDKDAIGALYGFMEAHPQAGACGSVICRMEEPDFIQDYGAMIDVENLGVKPLHRSCKAGDDLPEFVECDYVAACSAMYRTSVLQQTGIIDKDFFIYWDDMSLSWKIRLAGYKICACSKSKVWHRHGLGEHENTFGIYYFFRNKLYSFAKYCTDEEYAGLSENLVKRLFRTFAVNRDRHEVIYTYMHALNDVLNNVRGKAADFKILPVPLVDTKFRDTFSGKMNILLLCSTYDFDFRKLIKKLKSVTDAGISICRNGFTVPVLDGIQYVESPDMGQYDAIVRICPHVLDEPQYDRSCLYIDLYMNQILDKDDFDFFENLDSSYTFFHTVFSEFIKSKLDALRATLHNGQAEKLT